MPTVHKDHNIKWVYIWENTIFTMDPKICIDSTCLIIIKFMSNDYLGRSKGAVRGILQLFMIFRIYGVHFLFVPIRLIWARLGIILMSLSFGLLKKGKMLYFMSDDRTDALGSTIEFSENWLISFLLELLESHKVYLFLLFIPLRFIRA